jgi:hypothetical protein
VHETDDLIAHLEAARVRAEFGHHAGEVAALTRRKCRRPAIGEGTGSDRRLARVDAGGLHLDDDLAGPGGRPRHVDHLQYIDAAEAVVANRLGHARTPHLIVESPLRSTLRPDP